MTVEGGETFGPPPARGARSATNRPSGKHEDAPRRPLLNSANLIRGASYGDDRRTLTVHTEEKSPLIDAWLESQAEFSTSFEIVTAVPSGASDEFYVAGFARNGDFVLEHWELEESAGGWRASRPKTSTPLGQGVAQLSTVLGVHGGTFIVPTEREGQTTVVRTEIYRGDGVKDLQGIAADPDGRFVLVLDGASHDLIMIAEGAPAVLSTIIDHEVFSELSRVNGLSPRQHAQEGRLFILDALPSGRVPRIRIVLTDVQNDGVFDGIQVLTDAQWAAQGYDGAVWLDDFMNYPLSL